MVADKYNNNNNKNSNSNRYLCRVASDHQRRICIT
ncbi:unnamed protein product [Spirodela intermedia]|uniref:Uncharacterized protein n=1 Tax=Spirodela intermedia TaxID=51605 RepID=A0A7I8JJV7_SPIIN|nr:unnamed protein product [Spirodela intermedia]CAA6670141.1 unnamed protein product [Spirodela intermedia]